MSVPPLPEYPGSEPSAAELATSRDPRLGIAYAVSVRTEGGGQNSVPGVVLSYRLHRRGPDGRELPVLQVEMRGRNLQGMIADGDLIQAPGPLPPSGMAQLETVTNLTTGSPVVLKRPNASAGCLIATLVMLSVMVLLVVVAFIVFALTSST
jgi:hypothetical protein